jgi:hypothetical protein
MNDIIPACFKDTLQLDRLGFIYKNVHENIVCVYYGRGKTIFGKDRLLCIKCTTGKNFKSSKAEVAIMERLYYCAGVSPLVHVFQLPNAYAVVTEKLSENCITMDEMVKHNGQECCDRENEHNRYFVSLTESIIKKIFKQVLKIVNGCYLRGVRNLQWHDLKNYWIDLKTYQIQLWNFEKSDFNKFACRKIAVQDEQRTVQQLGWLLKTLVGDLKVSDDCRAIIHMCFQDKRPTLRQLRCRDWCNCDW